MVRMTLTQSSLPGNSAPHALLIEFLQWVADQRRTYAETMEAWRTSCPRMPVWEDAIGAGLIRVAHSQGTSMNDAPVELTPSGRSMLAPAV
jgi:hypothetical protein